MTRHVVSALVAAALALTPARVTAQAGASFDHSALDRLLRAHVSEEGLVDYEGFSRSGELDEYLTALAAAPLGDLPEAERLALWINAYNAYTIALIIRRGERESIRNINRTLGLFAGKGPWKERFATVGGHTYTLDEIEHEIIRVRFEEPRIHFALVCAAMACPPLRREAYTGARLDAQLEDQGRRFLAGSPAKNRVDVATRTLHLSPIFDWYRDDFPAGLPGLGRYLARFFPPGPERTLLESGGFDIAHTDYDWSLNAGR